MRNKKIKTPSTFVSSYPFSFYYFHPGFETVRNMTSLWKMHLTGPLYKLRPPRQPLDGKPFAKGVVLKTLIKKPKKPNSANRKCVLVRLSTGKEMVAYVPGIKINRSSISDL